MNEITDNADFFTPSKRQLKLEIKRMIADKLAQRLNLEVID